MNNFPAFYVTKTENGPQVNRTELNENDLMQGDVTIQIVYSTINYKDALAMTNSAPIIRKFPLIPGIDLAGIVTHSENDRFKPGQSVLVTGYGIGETHHGGYAAYARVNAEWLVPIPDDLSLRQSMAIGTAGFTAMLGILKLEQHGIKPDNGPLLVTGASGGVGSIAVTVLSKLGYQVTASTGKPQESDYLKSLGAVEIIDRKQFSQPAKPLAREHWAAAVEVAGGNTLANVISQTSRAGAVAVCGLAESMDLHTSVAPFILRGVTLYGIDSVMCPMPKRLQAWDRLANDLDLSLLDSMTTEISFDHIPSAAEDLLAGKSKGRIVVKIPV